MSARALTACALAALSGVLGSVAAAADIDVSVIHFGAGDVVRGGGPVAVQVEFRSALDKATEIEAAWEIPNADLDIAEYSRRIVLNPGQAQRRWLYGTMPPYAEGALAGSVFDLRLYELSGGVRVRDLGTARIGPGNSQNPTRALSLAADVFAVVGPRAAGLDIFAQAQSTGTIPSMHAVTAIANLRDADDFPDRWEGYATFDSLVWANGAITPSRLSEESARALAQWMERGGNFVVALPAAGDPWSVGVDGRHGLSALLPTKAPVRIDDVPVRELLPMLSVSNDLRDPNAKTRLAVFDAATLDRGWRPFIATPATKAGGTHALAKELGPYEGKLVGIRREVGVGHFTLLGLDVEELSSRGLQVPALPQGDVFWNRILARRADTPSGAEYTELSTAGRMLGNGGYSREIGDGKRVQEAIGLSGQAAVGVLAATAVFGLYWLVAGPAGYALLKSIKREKWSWVAFVGIAAVFTVGIALAGRVTAARNARVNHLTVLDFVERAQGEGDITQAHRARATSWFSLFAPGYGMVELSVDPGADVGVRNLVSSWQASSSSSSGFPSRERYRVPIDGSDRVSVPSRATSIDFEAQWLGGVAERWGRLPHVKDAVSVSIDESRNPAQISIAGSLQHALPGTLKDVLVIHVWPKQNPLQSFGPPDGTNKPPTRSFSAQLPNRGAMVSLDAWPAGRPLELSQVFAAARLNDRSGLESTLLLRYYEPIAKNATLTMGLGGDTIGLNPSLEMLSIYGMIPPPPYLRSNSGNDAILRFNRTGARDLDLSGYFAQPCLIVMGFLDNAALPFPLLLDGDPVASEGRVMVRWVLPLPADADWIVPDRIPRGTKPPAALLPDPETEPANEQPNEPEQR